jgi:hypothetical protein
VSRARHKTPETPEVLTLPAGSTDSTAAEGERGRGGATLVSCHYREDMAGFSTRGAHLVGLGTLFLCYS